MADEERKILIDVEVENKDFDKEIGDVNKELSENQKLIRDLKKDYSANSTEIAKLEARNRSLTQSKKALIKEQSTEANSLDALRLKLARLTKERNETNTSTIAGAAAFDRLQKEIKETSDEIKGFEEEGGDFRRSVGNYPKQLGSAIPMFGRLRQQIISLTAAAKAFIATPLGLILGAIALAISAVTAAFSDSEEGQNKFAKISAVVGVVLGNLRDILASLGELIIETFENPQKAIEDFKNLIVENITNRFEGLLELIPNLGKAIKLLFQGNFSEAGEVALNAVAKVTLGVEDFTQKAVDGFNAATEAVSTFISETEREIELAKRVADDRAKADKLERKLLVDRAKIESEIAELKLKSRQEDEFSAEQRKQALIDAQDLEDKLLKREQEVLKLRSDAIALENTFSRSTKENLDAEAQAKSELFRIEASRINQQRQTQRELNRINKEIERDEKLRRDEIEKRIQKEQDAANELEILRLEEQQKFEDAEIRKREILLENTELGENERALIIAKSENKINEIRKKAAEKQAQIAKDAADLQKAQQQELVNIVAGLFEEGTAAAKVAGLAQIAYSTGVAVARGIAAAQAVPFPGNLAAIGTTLAQVYAGISQARKLFSEGDGEAPTSTLVAPTSAAVPSGLANVNASLLSQFGDPARTNQQNTNDVVQGVSNLPPIYVAVEEINRGQNRLAVKVSESKLG